MRMGAMGRIEKAYFTLDEVEERWGLPHRDVVYLAENGLLRLSVRLFGAWLESGTYEPDPDGCPFRLPHDQPWFTGLQDLTEHDAFRVLRDGTAEIHWFHAEEGHYVCLAEPGAVIPVHRADLVVRRSERDRVERAHALAGGGRSAPAFRQVDDYREVHAGGLTFQLGPVQAAVVRLLHAAAERGSPWCIGKVVLADAGSASSRMADVFKSQPHWRRLIASDRRGRYRLILPSRQVSDRAA